MKIIHVCPFIGEQLGGSERYVYNLSKEQVKNQEVHIITTTNYLSRTGTCKKDGIILHRLYSPSTIWNIDPLCFAISKFFDVRYDILHVHSYLYSLSVQATLTKIAQKRKSILQLHGGVGPPPYKTSFTKLYVKHAYDRSFGKFVIENSDIVSSVSRKDMQYVFKHFSVDKKNLRYIPNAVDIKKFSGKKPIETNEKLTFLYIGDLELWKGLSLIVDWIQSDLVFPCKIRFVGQGSLYPWLNKVKDILKTKNTGAEIELLGQVPHREIPKIIRNSHALLLPSYWEGMPTVVLEAMACGVPPIVTNVGDIGYVIENKVNGLIIKRNIQSLNNALQFLRNNPSIVDKLGISARTRIEREFNIKNVSGILHGLYEETLRL
ncbi:MAG: putative Glycogen synthase [Candidatus Thorarchaeota archaeon]|nr:MAG: putative Glycogen synthase [Candidatus Thorarchaeota archaeon]